MCEPGYTVPGPVSKAGALRFTSDGGRTPAETAPPSGPASGDHGPRPPSLRGPSRAADAVRGSPQCPCRADTRAEMVLRPVAREAALGARARRTMKRYGHERQLKTCLFMVLRAKPRSVWVRPRRGQGGQWGRSSHSVRGSGGGPCIVCVTRQSAEGRHWHAANGEVGTRCRKRGLRPSRAWTENTATVYQGHIV